MRGRHFSISICAALIGLVALAGCGDGDGADTATAAPTKTEFVKKANAICEKIINEMGPELYDATRNFGSKSQSVVGAEIAKATVPGFEAEIRRIRALGVPPGDQAEIDAILAAIQETIDRLNRLSSSAAARKVYPYGKSEKLAAAYGLAACGHS